MHNIEFDKTTKCSQLKLGVCLYDTLQMYYLSINSPNKIKNFVI